MRRLLQLELDDAKDKLVSAPEADMRALQGGARVLRMLLSLLTDPVSDITPKLENDNG